MRAEPVFPSRERLGLNPAFSVRPLDLESDIKVIHPWFQMDYAHYWNMQHLSLEGTRDFYASAAASGRLQACMGLHDDAPAFVVEYYDPAQDPLGQLYPVQPGDIGMHFFVGPSHQPVRHYTRDVLRTVMAYLFDHLSARRVVVEPDVRNTKVHRLNAMVGFVNDTTIELPGKTAQLAFCTPTDFAYSLRG
ncbi:hypothetical protein LCGC14_0212020 [marine sediment metagenome]